MKPIFIENSKVPIILSYIAPIKISAITLGPFVFSRGKMDDITRRHESIHWEQYKETLIIGFWILYLFYWIAGIIKYRDPTFAYASIPFEQEAYQHDDDWVYLLNRKRFAWRKYKV